MGRRRGTLPLLVALCAVVLALSVALGQEATPPPDAGPSPEPASNVAPATQIISAPSGMVRGDHAVSVTVHDTDPGDAVAAVEYAADAATPPGGGVPLAPSDGAFDSASEDATATLDVCAFGDGDRELRIRSRDTAGAWGADAVASFTVDCTAPPPPAIDQLPSHLDRAGITITGTKEPGSGVWLDGAEVVAPGPNANWSYSATLEPGPNTFTFRARDAAGNESDPTSITITHGVPALFVTVDPVATPTREGAVVLRGRRTLETVVTVNGVAVDASTTEGWSHAATLVEGSNAFRVVAVGANGEESSPVDVAIVRDSLPPGPPKRLRTTPSGEGCVVADRAAAEWDAATDSGTGVVQYRYGWDAQAAGGATDRISPGTGVSDALSPGRWYFHVVAVDGAGNVSEPRHTGPICLLGEGGAIAGAVFLDADGDGRYAFGDEPGLADWRVVVEAEGSRLDALSGGDGEYRLAAPAGRREVCAEVPSRYRIPWFGSWGATEPGDRACRTVELEAAEGSGLLDFGFYRPARLAGRAFLDDDRDGRFDSGERGLGGVTVTATNGRGEAARAVSDGGGAYSLSLAPGEWLFCASTPAGVVPTNPGPDLGCWAVAVRSEHHTSGPGFGFAAP